MFVILLESLFPKLSHPCPCSDIIIKMVPIYAISCFIYGFKIVKFIKNLLHDDALGTNKNALNILTQIK